jgi:dTDP-4-dehydrorhamnose reductase
MSSKKVLVFGKNGQLASELNLAAEGIKDQFIFHFLDRKECDLERPEQIIKQISAFRPDIVINASAYTQVDQAESDREVADRVNHLAVAEMAKACKEFSVWFIHISTDFVFDGKQSTPYLEDDPTNPQGVYGLSKLQGEQALLSIAPEHFTVLRTSWVYSNFGNNFVKTIDRLCQSRGDLSIVFDQVGSPTYAKDLAFDLCGIIEQGWSKEANGIFHYSNEGVTSWYDFAQSIRDLKGYQTNITAIRSAEYPTPAKRPSYSVMDKTKIKRVFGLNIRHWEKALNEMIKGV